MKNLEEATKIAREAHFATLARQLADRAAAGESITAEKCELAQLRRIEQESASALIRFAALGRQIGDAVSVGRDSSVLVNQLVILRQSELGARHLYDAEVQRRKEP